MAVPAVIEQVRLTRAYGLEPDMLTIGKSIASGVPLAAYGMTEDIGAYFLAFAIAVIPALR